MADGKTFERDIDIIIQKVQRQLPAVKVTQWHKKWPADDDGIWWFYLPGIKQDIQVESSFGVCPFVIETDEFCCDKSRIAATVDDAILTIVEYLKSLNKTVPPAETVAV